MSHGGRPREGGWHARPCGEQALFLLDRLCSPLRPRARAVRMNATEGERPDAKEALEKYSELAPTYDRLTRRSAPMRRLAVKRLDLQAGQTVLDIGCGTGLTFSLLEKQIGREGRLVGV